MSIPAKNLTADLRLVGGDQNIDKRSETLQINATGCVNRQFFANNKKQKAPNTVSE